MFDSTVRGLDAVGCAAAIEANERLLVEHSCRQLILAAHFADLYPVEGILRPDVPGGETAWHPGGDGTPAVAGFCFAELAGLLGTTAGSAARLVGDALDVRHRLPLIWRRIVRCEIPGYLARKIAQATRHLTAEAAGLVDVELVDKLGVLPAGRLLRCLDAAVLKADPETARREAEQAAKERFVRLGRDSEHGLKWVIARCAAGDALFLDAMVARIADILTERGDLDGIDVRRSKALGILAQPAEAMRLLHDHAEQDRCPEPVEGQDDAHQSVEITPPPFDPVKARPQAVIYVHLSQEALQAVRGVGRIEGVGPVLLAQLRTVLGDLVGVKLQPVIDLNDTPAAVDCYEIPDRIREHLLLRNPADLFPYASGMARGPNQHADLDHTVAYHREGPPGQTRVGNLAPLRRFHHRVRTHSSWSVRQPEPGTLLWRSPLGRIYLVNSTGTHRLGNGPYARALWRAAGQPGAPSYALAT